LNKIIKQAGKGVLAGYVLTLVNILRKLIIIPIALGFIGQSLYGIWIIIGEVMGYLRNIEGGMGFAVEQRIASVKWEKNLSKLNIIFTNGLAIYLFFSILAIVVGLCLTPFFITIFNVDSEYHSLVKLVFLLTVVSMGLGLPLDVISSFLRGVQQQARATSIAIVGTLIGFIIVLLLLFNGLGLLALPLSGLIVLTFSYWFSWYLLKRAEKGISISIKYINKKIAKDLMGFSFFAFVNQISSIVIFSTDAILIGYFLGTDRVPTYVLTFQLILTLIGFALGVSSQLQPGFSELSYKKDTKQLRSLFIDTLRLSMVFAGLVVAFTYFMNIYFVSLWVGQNNYGGQSLTLVFSLIGFYTVLRQHCISLLLCSGDVEFVAKWSIIEAFLNLTFSLVLVQYFGLIGVAIGTLSSGLIVAIFLFLPKISRKVDIPIFKIISIIIIRPVIFSIPVWFVCGFLTIYIFKYIIWTNFFLNSFIAGFIGLLLIWFSLEKNQKIIILNILKRK